jgi:HTH-type transcriptional regulator/antitoxin HigA
VTERLAANTPARTSSSLTSLPTRSAVIDFEDVPEVAAAPGHYLRAVLEDKQIPQAQLAARTGLSAKHINQVIQGVASLSPEMAVALERALGVPSRTWNRLEALYQDSQARERAARDLQSWTAWFRRFPVAELKARHIVNPQEGEAGQVGELLSFFGVADPPAYDRVWSSPVASGFRRAQHLSVDPYATAVWLRLAEKAAESLDLATYDAQALQALLPSLRALTLLDDDAKALEQLQEACRAVGLAVVHVPEIKGSRACGAARWPRSSHPLIVLSGRYRFADSLWFSFFHECAHVIHHAKRETYIHLDKHQDDADGLESDADRHALRYLLGSQVSSRLRAGLTYDQVRQMADEAGVDPGAVAGPLSYAINDYTKYARLRRKLNLPA